MMKIAAAYIRVSTDDQTEFSPDSQIKAIKNYARKNNMILPEHLFFEDEGISGRSIGKREGFKRMIALAKTTPKPFDVILVWKYSRFARNREDSVVYKSMLRKQCGIDVVSVSETIGDDKMSVLLEAMIEAMDEYYSINLAEEVRRGMAEKARQGGVLSVPPFGYEIRNGEFVIVPAEAEIIKNVFESYAAGDGFLKIAERLNAWGVRTHRGNLIENRTVEYWLNNPAYIGKTRWNPSGRNKANDVIIAEGRHEAIVDIELWERVRELLRDNKAKYQKYQRNSEGVSHWLSGVLRCGRCGHTLVNCGGFFYCSKKIKGFCSGNGGVCADKIGDAVIEKIHEMLDDGDITVTVDSSSHYDEDNGAENIIRNKIAEEKGKLLRVRQAYEAGIDDIDEYGKNKIRIGAEIHRLESMLKQGGDEQNTPDSLEEVYGISDILRDSKVNNEVKNRVVKSIIKEIIKTDDGRCSFRIVFWGM